MKYFTEGARTDIPYQADAFLTYWLSYLVFPSPSEDGLNSFVFPMALALA